jgi:translocation and assembly module TamB
MSWKKVIRWASAALVLLVIGGLASGYFALKTPRFHQYVLAKIVENGQAATGGKLEVQNWVFHFSPLSVDLYGVVLHGTEPERSRPLLRADKLAVGVNFRSLLHRKLQLSEIVIQHPVANMQVASDGTTNLPASPQKQSDNNTTVWDLAIEHTLLTNGEVYYNDKKTQITADLYDLKTEIRFDASATRYSGSLSYRNGRLRYATYSPLAHNLDARFSATRDGATLDSLLLTVGSSQISLHGDMTDYNSPKLNAVYQLQVRTQDFAGLSPDLVPAGDLQLAGEMHYQAVPNQPLLLTLALDGNVTSSDLQAVSSDGRLELRDLKAQYRLAKGNLDIRGISADVLGGQLSADLGMKGLNAAPKGIFSASVKHLSIESARWSINRQEVKRMPVTGAVDAKVNGSWAGSIKNVRLLGDVGLRAAVWNNSAIPRSTTPLDGTVHVTYDGARNSVTLRQTTLRIPSTSVVLDGEIGDHSNLRIHAIAGDLHQLTELAASLRTTPSEEDSDAPVISGTATLDAVVQGSMRNPRFTGQVEADNLQVQGSQWKSARLKIEANPSEVKILQGVLVNAHQGELSFSGEVGLKQWSYSPSSPVTANLSANGMSVADLEHLANREDAVNGNLSANISFRGSQLHPTGHGSVQIVRASAYNQPIQNLTVQFQAANDSIDSTLNLNLPAGTVSANLAYTPKTRAYKVELHTPRIVLQKLQAVLAKDLPLAGTLTASASGTGTIDNPQLDVVLQIPTLQVRQTAVTEMKAQLTIQNQRATLALSSNITPAFVRANATVELIGDYDIQATIDTNKVPLDPFLAVYLPSVPTGFHGESELHASLKGPLKDRSRLEAHVTIPTLSGSYQSLQFSNAGPIHADYAGSVLTLQPAEIRGTQTSLTLQGRIPVRSGGAMSAQTHGTVNLGLLAMFSSGLKSAGTVDFDVHGTGTIRQPSIDGKIEIKDAALSTADAPVSLSNLNGTLDVTKDKLQIASLKGEVGGGQVSVGGSITYSPTLQFGLSLQGKSIRLLYPDGVRTVLDSNLTFTGNMQAASLSGRALVDSLNFTPDFDLSSFAGQFNGISVPSSGESFADNIKLAVVVQSSQSLSARSSQLNLEGIANLQIQGSAATPVIVGRIDLTSGELFFLNNRYQLQRGIVTFNDPNETRPILNVQVTSTIQQYNLTLKLTGPLDKLTTSYVSDPSLPTADIISLIYRGQTDEEAAASGTSTDSLLASQAAGQFSSGIQKLAGISSLQIDPTIGGNNANPSATIALQQRVTNKLLFTFSTDVTQPQQEIVQGEYQINKRWSVSVTRDELGGIAVDGRLHTKF